MPPWSFQELRERLIVVNLNKTEIVTHDWLPPRSFGRNIRKKPAGPSL